LVNGYYGTLQLRYDMIEEFNVDYQLNLAHG